MNHHPAVEPQTISRRRFLLGVAAVGGAGLATFAGLSHASAANEDPIRASRFSISIDGVEIATFKSIGGLTSEQEVIEYVETDRGEEVLKKLPGKRTPPTVTLKRGKNTTTAGSNLEMASWHEAARFGLKIGIRDATFTMYNLENKPVARYYLENAWPSKFELGALTAGATEPEMETVTIVAERIQRVSA